MKEKRSREIYRRAAYDVSIGVVVVVVWGVVSVLVAAGSAVVVVVVVVVGAADCGDGTDFNDEPFVESPPFTAFTFCTMTGWTASGGVVDCWGCPFVWATGMGWEATCSCCCRSDGEAAGDGWAGNCLFMITFVCNNLAWSDRLFLYYFLSFEEKERERYRARKKN